MAKNYQGNNKGGYGNPPIRHQFQKGCKPGPGRPPGSKSMEGALRKVFGGKLTYNVAGKPVTSSAPIALATRALGLGLTGPLSANAAAIEIAARYGPQDTSQEFVQMNFEGFTAEELETFDILFCRAYNLPYEPPVIKPHPLDPQSKDSDE